MFRGGFGEVFREAMYAEKTSAELSTSLIERSGLGGGLIEEGVVGDGCFDLEAVGGDDRFFAASDGRHDGRGEGLQSASRKRGGR